MPTIEQLRWIGAEIHATAIVSIKQDTIKMPFTEAITFFPKGTQGLLMDDMITPIDFNASNKVTIMFPVGEAPMVLHRFFFDTELFDVVERLTKNT